MIRAVLSAGGNGMTMSITNQQRIAWSLAEISESTGLSLGFLRNDVRRGALPIKRFGRRVLVLKEDLENYLTKGSQRGICEEGEAQP
jgi:excisionase family DNA binding protein